MEQLSVKEKKELEGLAKELDQPAPAHHVRFSDAVWYKPLGADIVLGGAGGIGSWLALFLSRAGYTLNIFDNDIIDQTNMAGQFYSSAQIGVNKATAVADLCIEFAQMYQVAFPQYTVGSRASAYMISAFDNMAARKLMFEKWKGLPDRKLFIDGRMLAESGQVYFVTPENQDAYETQLFDDKEVKEQPCSMKATSHCGAHIASVMMSGFTNFLSNQILGIDAREVPFKLEFELPLLMWTTKTKEECRTLST